jgi:VIT1/CCC1 family predicted Fe2+/Mn2+ transporter
MYNLLISAAASVAVLLIMIFVLHLPWWGSLLVTFIIFGIVFVIFSKITMKKVMASIESDPGA